MNLELPELENLYAAENHLEALRLVDAELLKNRKNITLLKHKALLIQRAPGSPYSLRNAEKCLLRAHQLAPENLDIIHELTRFYRFSLKEVEKSKYFDDLFCAIVERKTGLPTDRMDRP